MNTFLLCVSDATSCKHLSLNCGASSVSENLGKPQKPMIDDRLCQNWSTLHSHSIDLQSLHAHLRTPPLANLVRPQKGGFHPDGRFATLQGVIEHNR
jgi:hypothetical protein